MSAPSSHRAATMLLALVFPLALALLWWGLSAFHLVSSQLLPSPAKVLARIAAMAASGELWVHIGWSIRRIVAGFAIGAGAGLVLGTAMALSARARAYLYPTFSIFIYVPILAWLPVLMLFLGLGETLKLVLIAKAALVPVTLQTFNAVRDVPYGFVEVARVNRLTRPQSIVHVVLPAAFPAIWTGLRYAHGRAWAALVIVELLASSEGLGFLVIEGQQLLQIDLLIAAIIVLAVIGFTLDRLLALPERWVARWRQDGFVRPAA